MSQRQPTFADLELNYHESKTIADSNAVRLIREYKNKVVELTNQLQQVTADLAREKVKNSKEPGPKPVKPE